MDRPGGGEGSLGESEENDFKVREEASLRSAFLGADQQGFQVQKV